MKTKIAIFYLLMSICCLGCGRGFTVEFENNRTATLHLAEAKEQTLWLPIDDKAPMARLVVEGSERMQVPMRVRLAVDSVGYYMPLHLESHIRTIRIEDCSFESLVWERLYVGKKSPMKVSEKFRQQAHFTPDIGWINDPNGLVYHQGEWHLFYQHNPLGARWANMSWGHAVSRDLVHWEQLPIVLYPDSLGQIYSGSAVIDTHNSAGFGPDAMVAIYTSSGKYQTQSIAYSQDGGRTFTKYAQNPVLNSTRADFRDPKVFFHTPTRRWIMPLACGDAMEFYSSPNLKDWQFESRFGDGYGCHGGEWECPDLIELPWEGGSKWVLLCSLTRNPDHGSSIQYFVGDFDGHTFVCDSPKEQTEWLSYGRDNYAMVSWSNAPDNRKVAIGWQNNWQYGNGTEFPSTNFRGYMTLACEMALISYEGRPRLVLRPVPEYEAYLEPVIGHDEILLKDLCNVYHEKSFESPLWLNCRLEQMDAQVVGLRLFNDRGEVVEISFNRDERIFKVDRSSAGEHSFHEKFIKPSIAPMSKAESQSLQIVVDRSSVECFTDIASTSDLVFPTEGFNRISFFAIGGEVKICDLEIKKLKK